MSEEELYRNAMTEAERRARQTGKPQVVIEWSEHRDLSSGNLFEFKEANELLDRLDRENFEDGYYKTKLSMLCPNADGVIMHYDACRYDIGVEGGDLLHHIKQRYVSPYERFSKEDLDFLKRFIETLDDYLEKADKPKTRQITQMPVYVDGVSFAAQVDAVLSGADTSSTHLKVMTTPLLLRQAGARNLPVLMTAKHLKSIVQESGTEHMNYHGLGADLVKRLPELLSDPVMIMDSLTRDDSVVMLTATTDKQQRPVIAALKFDGSGYMDNLEIEANIITSVYGKDNFNNFIANNAKENAVIYWNKEKSQELTKIPGIQFPDNLSSLASNVIIRKAKAFVNSDKQNFTQTQRLAEQEEAKGGNSEQKKPLVVNFYAGPGAGKTTAAMDLTSALKKAGLNAEYVSEYAKELVWENKFDLLADQRHVTDEQYRRLNSARSSADIIVTDSPVMLGLVYGGDRIKDDYKQQVRSYYDSFNNLDFFVDRPAHYEQAGRIENQEQAVQLDEKVKTMLKDENIKVDRYEPSKMSEYVETIKAISAEIKNANRAEHAAAPKSERINATGVAVAPKKKSLNEEVNAARVELIKDLLARMEKGDLAWRHFASLSRPHNGADKRPYTGANIFKLWLTMQKQGWEDPRFFTFNQATEAGYRIKKGEHGVNVELWKQYDKQEKKYVTSINELRKRLEEKGLTSEQCNEYIKDNISYRGKLFKVFNGQQLDGIEKWQGVELDERQRNERCQQIITYSPVKIEQDTVAKAYYSPGEDAVHLPKHFDSYPAFYDTAFHEIGHATGHKSRLNRDMGEVFGSPSYAREELVAELTSVFVQSDLNVDLSGRALDNNAAYLKSWLEQCIDKPGDFFGAVRDAEKAAEYIQTAVKEKMEQSTDARNKAIANFYKQRRECTLSDLQANVPDEMKALKNWCVFGTFRDENGERKKRNICVYTGKWASVSDPVTWCSFDEAIKYAAERNYEGVTFVLTHEAGIHCIDLDECAGKRGGKREPMSEEARKFVEQASGAYMESSVSGTGVHIFFKGDMPDLKHTVGKGAPEGELEFYSDRKFISMTGNIERFGFDRVDNIASFDKTGELAAHLAARLGENVKAKPLQTTLHTDAVLSDRDVIDMLERSKSGEDFKRLMAGEDICGDHSRSDFRLMSMLAFATGNNAAQMQRIFESSGLYRPDKGDKYVVRTVDAAIRANHSQYNPGRKTGKSKPKGKA